MAVSPVSLDSRFVESGLCKWTYFFAPIQTELGRKSVETKPGLVLSWTSVTRLDGSRWILYSVSVNKDWFLFGKGLESFYFKPKTWDLALSPRVRSRLWLTRPVTQLWVFIKALVLLVQRHFITVCTETISTHYTFSSLCKTCSSPSNTVPELASRTFPEPPVEGSLIHLQCPLLSFTILHLFRLGVIELRRGTAWTTATSSWRLNHTNTEPMGAVKPWFNPWCSRGVWLGPWWYDISRHCCTAIYCVLCKNLENQIFSRNVHIHKRNSVWNRFNDHNSEHWNGISQHILN